MKRLILILFGLTGMASAQVASGTNVEVQPMTPEIRYYLTAHHDMELDKTVMLQRTENHVNLLARHANGAGLRFVTLTKPEAERLLRRKLIGKPTRYMDIFTDEAIVITGNTLELKAATIRAIDMH